MNIKAIPPHKNFTWQLPLAILVCINLIIGGFTYRDYGDSTDEAGLHEYAIQSLDAYKDFHQPVYVFHYVGYDVQYYGPAFVMGVELIVRIFHLPAPEAGPNAGDIWHLAYFISFLIGIICLYLLARRWMNDWSAFGIALLFSSQPLLWGHAFINPKDTPFLGFFLLSILTGLWLGDKIAPTEHAIGWDGWIGWAKQIFLRIKQQYLDLPGQKKKIAGTITLIVLLSMTTLVALKGVFNHWIASLIQNAYSAGPASLPGVIFSKLAHHKGALPIENYVLKAQLLFSNLYLPYFVLGILLILWLYRACSPWSIHFPSRNATLSFLKRQGLHLLRLRYWQQEYH